jgi:hypothetical protein
MMILLCEGMLAAQTAAFALSVKWRTGPARRQSTNRAWHQSNALAQRCGANRRIRSRASLVWARIAQAKGCEAAEPMRKSAH